MSSHAARSFSALLSVLGAGLALSAAPAWATCDVYLTGGLASACTARAAAPANDSFSLATVIAEDMELAQQQQQAEAGEASQPVQAALTAYTQAQQAATTAVANAYAQQVASMVQSAGSIADPEAAGPATSGRADGLPGPTRRTFGLPGMTSPPTASPMAQFAAANAVADMPRTLSNLESGGSSGSSGAAGPPAQAAEPAQP